MPMTDTDFPFKNMQGASQQSAREEYINIDHPDEDAIQSVRNEERLDLLGLNAYSTANEVRQTALSIRAELQKSGKLESLDKTRALQWVLAHTRDCVDDGEFHRFLFKNWGFQEIAISRG